MYWNCASQLLCFITLFSSSAGQEFMVAFLNPPVSFGLDFDNNYIILLTDEEDGVSVNMTSPSGELTVHSVLSSQPTLILLEAVRVMSVSDRDKGILLTAPLSKSLSVFAVSLEFFSIGGLNVLKCEELGVEQYEYYTVSVPYGGTDGKSVFVIAACKDGTTVTVTPTQDVDDPLGSGDSVSAGASTTVQLNMGQTLYLSSLYDLSGSRVVSSEPVSVFTGHECGMITPDNSMDCDFLVEQVPPVSAWGNSFYAVPTKIDSSPSNTYKIMTAYNNTFVQYFCKSSDTEEVSYGSQRLAKQGSSYNFSSADLCYITADRPVLVAQLSSTSSDAFMAVLPAVAQYGTNYTIPEYSISGVFYDNWVNVFVSASDYDPAKILVDGSAVSESDWMDIACSSDGVVCGWGTQVQLTSASVHTVEHTDPAATLGVFLYGLSPQDAYAYNGGLRLSPLPE